MVSIAAIDIGTGKTKWEHKVEFPSLGSTVVTSGLVFSGYIPFAEKPCIKYTITPFGIPKKITAKHQSRTGLILALNKVTGQELGKFNVAVPIVVDGRLYVHTGRIHVPKGEGSIIAFRIP